MQNNGRNHITQKNHIILFKEIVIIFILS